MHLSNTWLRSVYRKSFGWIWSFGGNSMRLHDGYWCMHKRRRITNQNYHVSLFLYCIEASLCTRIHSSFHSFKTEANVWRTVVMAQFHACGIVYTLLLALYQLLVWWCGSHHLFICMHVYYNIVMCSVSPYYNLHQWWYHTTPTTTLFLQ